MIYIEGIKAQADDVAGISISDAAGTGKIVFNFTESLKAESPIASLTGGIIEGRALEIVSFGKEKPILKSSGANSVIDVEFVTGSGGFESQAGVLNVRFNNIKSNYYVKADGGTMTINGIEAVDTTSTLAAMIATTAGILRHNVNRVSGNRTAGALNMVDHSGGVTELVGIIDNKRSIAASNGIKVSSGGLTLDNVLVLVTNSTSDAITATSAQDVTSRYSTYKAPIDSDITFLESVRIGDVRYDKISDANARAVSGELVTVESRFISDELNIVKSGINYHFEKNSGATYTGSDDGAIIDDTAATGQGGAIVSTITGYGEFKRLGTGNGASFKGVLFTEAAGSNIKIECLRMEALEACTIFIGDGTCLARILEDVVATA